MSFSPISKNDLSDIEDIVNKRAKIIFDKYDSDGDGFLNPKEIRQYLVAEKLPNFHKDILPEVNAVLVDDEGLADRLRYAMLFPLNENDLLTFDNFVVGVWDEICMQIEKEAQHK
jgi:hypothetical protein